VACGRSECATGVGFCEALLLRTGSPRAGVRPRGAREVLCLWLRAGWMLDGGMERSVCIDQLGACRSLICCTGTCLCVELVSW
jgi:hypothetical protein